jgi:plastocyanin
MKASDKSRTRLGLVSAAAVAAAVLALAGCGGSSSSTAGSGSASATATASTPAGTASASATGTRAGAVAIRMQNIEFSPKTAKVRVGEKITWTNDDSVQHNVTATKGASFKSANFGQGGTYTFTAKKPGTISYTCTIHPGMDGTLTVTK